VQERFFQSVLLTVNIAAVSQQVKFFIVKYVIKKENITFT